MTQQNVRDSSHIPISFGYIARGQEALLKSQKNDMELQKLEREQAQEMLLIQHEAVKGNVIGIDKAASAEAYADQLDAINYGTQMGTGVVQIGTTAGYQKWGVNSKLKASEEKMTKLNDFEKEFKDAPAARVNYSDEERAGMTQDQKSRLQEIENCEFKEGRVELKDKAEDIEILKHVKAEPAARQRLQKHINNTRESILREQNTIVTNAQTKLQMLGLGFTIVNNASNTANASLKQETAMRRGYAQATSALAQNAEQNANTSLNDYMQSAGEFDQQAIQINRAREALAGNGQG